MNDIDIEGAIERAASAGDHRISGTGGIGKPAVLSAEQENRIVQMMRCFLEAVPADATAGDLLEALENR